MHADVRCLGGRGGEGDGAVERGAGFLRAAQLQEQTAAQAVWVNRADHLWPHEVDEPLCVSTQIGRAHV